MKRLRTLRHVTTRRKWFLRMFHFNDRTFSVFSTPRSSIHPTIYLYNYCLVFPPFPYKCDLPLKQRKKNTKSSVVFHRFTPSTFYFYRPIACFLFSAAFFFSQEKRNHRMWVWPTFIPEKKDGSSFYSCSSIGFITRPVSQRFRGMSRIQKLRLITGWLFGKLAR